MPSLPMRPCSCPGCRQLVAAGSRCPDHGKEANEYERRRLPAHKRGYNHAWNDLRTAYIRENPFCELRLTCQDRSILERLATEVHHRRPIQDAPELCLDWSNLASACGPCHDEIERRENVS